MRRSSTVRSFSFFALALAFPAILMGCPKKQPAVEDAGAPPPVADTPDVTVLQALTEDAGDEAEAEAGKKWTGPAVNPNQLKIQACCSAMRAQAKQLGSSPEAFQIQGLAAQCDMFAKQVGPAGNAPEFNQLRAILKSVKLPAACSTF
jgi:hypothetical protein